MQKNPWNWRKPHAQEPEVAIDDVKTEEPEKVAKKKVAKKDG